MTGGAGHIGLESARSLLEHGASGVCLFDMESSFEARAESLALLRKEYPDRTILTQDVDVTDESAVSSAVSNAKDQLGSIDHMLCFAGIVATIPAMEMTPQNWRKVLDINVSGSWYCAQAAAKQMIKQESGGSILFTASISAHQVNFPQPQVSYNVSKSAILQLTRSLAAEWAQYGIRVNSLSPGYMDTVLTMLNDGKGLEVGKEIWETRNPMGRMGTPEELTGAVVLFSSTLGGRYLTGEDIKVDGSSCFPTTSLLIKILTSQRNQVDKQYSNRKSQCII